MGDTHHVDGHCVDHSPGELVGCGIFEVPDGSRFFVDGQIVVEYARYGWSDVKLSLREDTGSGDRTFENETRINTRQPLQPKDYWF